MREEEGGSAREGKEEEETSQGSWDGRWSDGGRRRSAQEKQGEQRVKKVRGNGGQE